MSLNLLDLFKDQVGGELVSQASKNLGAPESNITSALGGILPGLLGSIINKGSSADGAAGILDLLNSGSHDGGILDNLGGLFGGGSSTDGLMSTGSTLLKFFMGNKVGALVDVVTGMAGIKNSTASSLLRMAAPMLVGLIGKHVKSNGLNASGLMDMLMGQRDHVRKAAPTGIAEALGLSGFMRDTSHKESEKKEAVASTATRVDTHIDDNNEGGGFGKFLPWLIGLALLIAAFMLLRTCNSDGDVAQDDTETVGATSDDSGVEKAVDAAAEAIKSFTLPGGAEIKARVGSFTDKFFNLLGDSNSDIKKAYAFDRVNFETGSAKLTANSDQQLKNLAAILKAYPSATVSIDGHTDNTGDRTNNLNLSKQRALAVNQRLQSLGIAARRLAANGYGPDKPIATNNTPEGREQNRRVEVLVTKR